MWKGEKNKEILLIINKERKKNVYWNFQDLQWKLLSEISEILPERIKRQNQSKNNTQLWMWLVMEVKSNAMKNNIA